MVRMSYVITAFAVVVALSAIHLSRSEDDCATVTALFSACSSFVMYGLPDPIPGSPCCMAMESLNNLAGSVDNRRAVCRCVMSLIAAYSTNATAIATVPGFCGVSFGFPIDPNTDCEYIDQYAKLEGK